MTINHKNGKEMNVCFVDNNGSEIKVVGYGTDGNDALQMAVDCAYENGVQGNEDDVQEWIETLEQYFIEKEVVDSLEENGTCRCAFSDDVDNVVVKA